MCESLVYAKHSPWTERGVQGGTTSAGCSEASRTRRLAHQASCVRGMGGASSRQTYQANGRSGNPKEPLSEGVAVSGVTLRNLQEMFAVALTKQSDASVKLLNEGFERVRKAHCPKAIGWDEAAFRKGFLAELDRMGTMPTALEPVLFHMCDTTHDGTIELEEFLVAAAVVRHGSEFEKLMLLYNSFAKGTPQGKFEVLARIVTLTGEPAAADRLEGWLSHVLELQHPETGSQRAARNGKKTICPEVHS